MRRTVMRRRHLRENLVVRATVIGLIWTVIGCGAGPQVRTEKPKVEKIVARVDGQPITAVQLQKEVLRRQITPASAPEDEYNKQHVLDTLITNLAVRLEAGKFDYSGDHALRVALQQYMMQLALAKYVEEVITPRLAVTEADIDTYWREHPEQFTVHRDMVSPQHIQMRQDLKDDGYREMPAEYDGWDAAGIINDLFRRLQAGEDFDTLARKYSQDVSSRAQGGRLGWLYYDSIKVSPWQDSLFSSPTGKIMPPFSSAGSYYTVRINGRRAAGEVVRPDAAMRGEVAKLLGRQRMDTWMNTFRDSLVTAGNLEIIDTALEIPIPDIPDGLPLAISNANDTIFGYEYRTQSHFFKTSTGTHEFSADDKLRLLESIHQLRVIGQAMKDLGYQDRPELVRAREEYALRAIEMKIRAGATDRDYTPSEEAIRQFYDEHRTEFLPSRPIHVQHIVVDDPDTARAIKQRLDDGAAFVELAREYYRGDPEMMDVTYDLGFIAADDLPEQFFEAALQLDEGGVSAPVQTEWGFHIIRVMEIKEGIPFSKARQEIRSRLIKRYRADVFREWREELLRRHMVEIDYEMLRTVPMLGPQPTDTTTFSDSVSTPDQ